MRLNQIADRPGATKNRLRVARGVGSGKGKTAGRGVKGQKSRGGVSINGFEGGQMPIHMRTPKRGFTPPNQARYSWVNLGRIEAALESGKLSAAGLVDEAALVAAGLVRHKRDGVRLLAKGKISKAVKLAVTGASAAAIAAVEKAGGSVQVLKPAKPADQPAA
jgi:large subunit ribosomal protein L15